MKFLYLAFVILSFPVLLNAQVSLKGKIMDSRSDTPLGGATIFNRSQKIYRRASFEGAYSIPARDSDTIIFSSTGYRTDTLNVTEDIIRLGYDLGMKTLAVTLDTVKVGGRSYSADSLERRADYQNFYDKPSQKLALGNTPQTGFGASISPFSFFSKKERARRRFQKQLDDNEEQAYIDYNFSQAYVHRLTGLSGERLYLFMRTYRPTYQFVRGATQEDIFNYVNNSFKKFKESPPPETEK